MILATEAVANDHSHLADGLQKVTSEVENTVKRADDIRRKVSSLFKHSIDAVTLLTSFSPSLCPRTARQLLPEDHCRQGEGP